MMMMESSGQLQFLSEVVKNPITVSSFPGLGPCPPGRGNSGESPNLGESANFCLIPMWGKDSHFSGHPAGEMLVGILFCQLAHLPLLSRYHQPAPAPAPTTGPSHLPKDTASSVMGQVRALPSTVSHQQENNFPPQVFLSSGKTKLPSAITFHLTAGLMRKPNPSLL